MSGAILPFPLYAITAWTGATLHLLLPLWLGLYKVFYYMEWCIGLCGLQGCAVTHIDFYASLILTQSKGNAMVEKVIHQPLTAEVPIQYWANPCWISGGTRDTGSVFFFLIDVQLSLASIIPQKFHTHSFIHLPLMLYHLNNYQCHWVTPMWNKIWMSQ